MSSRYYCHKCGNVGDDDGEPCDCSDRVIPWVIQELSEIDRTQDQDTGLPSIIEKLERITGEKNGI